MKKLSIALALALAFVPTPAHAEEEVGGWALVDDSGQVLNIVVCTPSVCGDSSSEVSKSLPAGQRFVLQTQKQDSGNVAGWREATYNAETNVFSLPGNGTLVGGSRLEDVFFPKPELDEPLTIFPATKAASIKKKTKKKLKRKR